MDTTPQTYDRSCQHATRVCGTTVVIAGLVALAGWATEIPLLKGIRPQYIPMAPNTALAFIVLGLGLLGISRGGRVASRVALAGAVAVGVVAAARLLEILSGKSLDVDSWFIAVNGQPLGLTLTGKMSLPTSAAYLAASAAVATLALRVPRSFFGHVAGAGGVITTMAGLVFGLGYLFSPNAPLLYGTGAIPMALNTAISFVVLGVGLIAASGASSFPLMKLCGTTIQARLLRTFVPLVMATVGIVSWLTHLITTHAGARYAAVSSAALATVALAVFAVLCERFAGRIGGQLDRAEAELKQAHDNLETKVEERTHELSQANTELATSLGHTRRAHEALQKAHGELKQTQARMLQQAKLASLGQTAAGVAHEINNPLAFVLNNLFVLRKEAVVLHDILRLYQQAEPTLTTYRGDLMTKISDLADEVDLPFVLENFDGLLERTRAGLLRIQKIVTDLRDFAHLDEAEFQDVDLNEGIGTTVRLMQPIAGRNRVTIETRLNPLPKVSCFPAKINLVLQSLVANAIDACATGGKITIESIAEDDEIEIRISDNGSGIAPEIHDRIFDPFFTTKPIGQGTGLGLTISYGIIKDHGGTIDVQSSPGQGASFSIRLPLSPRDGFHAVSMGPVGSRGFVPSI